MLKLFVTLMVALLLALALLGLRHHAMELQAQSARLRDKIRQQENVLRDQEPEIAKATNPLVLSERLKKAGLDGAGVPPGSDGSVGGLFPGAAPPDPALTAAPIPVHRAGGIVRVSSNGPATGWVHHRVAP